MNKTHNINLLDVENFKRLDLNTIRLTFVFHYPNPGLDHETLPFYFNPNLYNMIMIIVEGGKIVKLFIQDLCFSYDKLYITVEFKVRGMFDFIRRKKLITCSVDCNNTKITGEFKQNQQIIKVTREITFATHYIESTFKESNCYIGC